MSDKSNAPYDNADENEILATIEATRRTRDAIKPTDAQRDLLNLVAANPNIPRYDPRIEQFAPEVVQACFGRLWLATTYPDLKEAVSITDAGRSALGKGNRNE